MALAQGPERILDLHGKASIVAGKVWRPGDRLLSGAGRTIKSAASGVNDALQLLLQQSQRHCGLTLAGEQRKLNHMVKYQDTALDRTFAALSDPTRRALLAQLELRDTISVSELARPFPVSLPAIMKHLDVLSDAGLITRTKTGRTVSCRLAAAPMHEAVGWLNRYQRFWSERLDRLAAFLEEDESCQSNPPSPQSPASPSTVVSMRRRKKSTPRGPSPKKS
jgi:DNA-binding transcriptional ArsR family regulator